VEVAAEVAAFEAKVCGDKDFAAGWRAEDRAVVAYSQGKGLASRGGKVAADLVDQGQLSHMGRIWLKSGKKIVNCRAKLVVR
jgi:hypothetical protein